MDPKTVAGVIRDEHPQIIATIVAHLSAQQGADVLEHLEGEQQNEVTLRLARLEEAVDVHRQTGQRMLEGHALAALGDVYFDLGQHEQALASYEASLQLRWALGDRRGEGWMLHRLAQVHAAQKETERAQQYTARALDIAVECGDAKLQEACRSLSI